jgi:hypothetical protein
MYAWPVRLPPPRRRVTRGENCTCGTGVFKFSGFLKAPANDGASFLRERDLLSGIKTPAGAILRGSPSLKEWQKSARLLPPDVPALQQHH